MCLDLKWNAFRQIAKEDIIVYKHLYSYPDHSNKDKIYYMTPYKRHFVEIGEVFKSGLKKEISNFFNNTNFFEVNVGIHSFKYINDCIYDSQQMTNRSYATNIVKCIIPKGAKYYVGEFENSVSYASTEIKYEKIIK